jgi:predicted ATP-binding protein involved in virulence
MASVGPPQRTATLSFFPPTGHSAALLQAITNLKVQAAMESLEAASGKGTGGAAQIVRMIENALTKMTGLEFAFTVTRHPEPTLQVRWGNAILSFDLLPDGLRSIIGWMVDSVVMVDAWTQGKQAVSDVEAVFLLDEIETHLHPAWQRRVLPAFQLLFPNAYLFVVTHSPFVIASLNHGWIHKLILEKDGKAKVLEPIPASAGDSYISVLEEIMGLNEWYDPETENLLAEFRTARDQAYRGDQDAKSKALLLAKNIASRSMELEYTMGREVHQMECQLAKAAQ